MTAPGRLGDPSRTIGTDPRTDPRLARAMNAFGLGGIAEPPPLTVESPPDELIGFCAAVEAAFDGLFTAAQQDVELPADVEVRVLNLPRPGVKLFVHRPAGVSEALPCVVHLHGGGMVILQADSLAYTRWRSELAAAGMVVVGVEFRNGAGALGSHPFPAGLDDCTAAIRWVHDNLTDLRASHIVVSGESGGANLALASVLQAKKEGWLDRIAGVYAQCPYIGDPRTPIDDRPSMTENAGYFLSREMLMILAEIYDPRGKDAHDPVCWPGRATPEDVAGLPPHVISVNELDPLRDEGLTYYRLLASAGVPVSARIVAGTCHAGDVIFRSALPDVTAATIRDIHAFARAVAPRER